MTFEIDEERKERLISQLQEFFLDQFDEEISPFRAEQVLDFSSEALGPQIYNQAVQDARKYMQQQLDDLDGEVYKTEPTR
ncbi:MAG TPA: DUF2164 domain-containing protein [Gemmatimonadetes bacterium]|nr:DUF2164 domain-containing protein [Gemmatimonadota bacterium]